MIATLAEVPVLPSSGLAGFVLNLARKDGVNIPEFLRLRRARYFAHVWRLVHSKGVPRTRRYLRASRRRRYKGSSTSPSSPTSGIQRPCSGWGHHDRDQAPREVTIYPLVSWPGQVAPGGSYLVTVDLPGCPRRLQEWPYDQEEFIIGCMLDGRPACKVRAIGTAGVVLHRFGGTYGAARFMADVSNNPRRSRWRRPVAYADDGGRDPVLHGQAADRRYPPSPSDQ